MKFTRPIQPLRFSQTLRNVCCRSKAGLWIAVIVSIITALSVSSKSHADTFEGIAVEVKGSGPAMVFIPGLTSSDETFTETCAAFQNNYTCHLLHLPGFAGQPATSKAQAQFLQTMRDSIRAYIKTTELEQPILVGHSLGGVLSLMLALEDPELASHLIIIDALPFYP